jgi:hypothetical protein
MLGVNVQCRSCGVWVTSCVLPAYCFMCNPANRVLIERIHEHAESARLNAKPAAEGEGRDDGHS